MSEEEPVRGLDLEVIVDNESIAGWETVEVVRPLDAASGSFAISVSGRRPWLLLPGQEVKVRTGDDILITGHVDSFNGTGGVSTTTIQVSGRDLTADMVDASEISEPGEWTGLTLDELVAAIATPFHIKVDRRIARGLPFPKFNSEPGETAWASVERACRLRGVLAYSAGDGRIALAQAATGARGGVLQEGTERGQVLSSSVTLKLGERFNPYIVRGQRPGSDDEFGTVIAQAEARARDPEIRRYRPLVIVAEGATSPQVASDRAQWEATVRAARAATLEVTVQGWRRPPAEDESVGDKLWLVNDVPFVDLPRWQIRGRMLISKVTYTRSAGGTFSRIKLVREDAYALQAEIPLRTNPFRNLMQDKEWF